MSSGYTFFRHTHVLVRHWHSYRRISESHWSTGRTYILILIVETFLIGARSVLYDHEVALQLPEAKGVVGIITLWTLTHLICRCVPLSCIR